MSIDAKITKYYHGLETDDFLRLLGERENGIVDPEEIENSQNLYRNKILVPESKFEVMIAREGDKPIGYVLGFPFFDEPEIDSLYEIPSGPAGMNWVTDNFYIEEIFVTEENRNQGVAKELIKSQMDWAKENGYRTISTYANPDQPFMAKLFKDLGMQEVHYSGNDHHDPINFEKEI